MDPLDTMDAIIATIRRLVTEPSVLRRHEIAIDLCDKMQAHNKALLTTIKTYVSEEME